MKFVNLKTFVFLIVLLPCFALANFDFCKSSISEAFVQKAEKLSYYDKVALRELQAGEKQCKNIKSEEEYSDYLAMMTKVCTSRCQKGFDESSTENQALQINCLIHCTHSISEIGASTIGAFYDWELKKSKEAVEQINRSKSSSKKGNQ